MITNKLKIIIKSLLVLLFISSCKTKDSIYNDLHHCINTHYNEIKEDIGFINIEKIKGRDIDIFDTIKKFENTLIELSLLKDKTKKGYINLLNSNIFFEKRNSFLDTITKKMPFYVDFCWPQGCTNIMYSSCPLSVIIDKKSYKLFGKTKIAFDSFTMDKYPKKKSLTTLIELTDFDNDTSRLLLCNLIFIDIYDGVQKWGNDTDGNGNDTD